MSASGEQAAAASSAAEDDVYVLRTAIVQARGDTFAAHLSSCVHVAHLARMLDPHWGFSLLHWICHCDEPQMLLCLLERLKRDCSDGHDQKKKHNAATLADVVCVLSKKKQTCLHTAAARNNVRVLRSLMKVLPPATWARLSDVRNRWLETPLHVAAAGGFTDFVRLLIFGDEDNERSRSETVPPSVSRLRVDINATDQWGRSPRFVAQENGEGAVADLLAAAGAKLLGDDETRRKGNGGTEEPARDVAHKREQQQWGQDAAVAKGRFGQVRDEFMAAVFAREQKCNSSGVLNNACGSIPGLSSKFDANVPHVVQNDAALPGKSSNSQVKCTNMPVKPKKAATLKDSVACEDSSTSTAAAAQCVKCKRIPLSKLLEYPVNDVKVRSWMADDGVDVAGWDMYGLTALHKLCSWDCDGLVAELLPLLSVDDIRRAAPAASGEGHTPLHAAIATGAVRAARVLLADRRTAACLDMCDTHGASPLTLAERCFQDDGAAASEQLVAILKEMSTKEG